MIDSIGYPSVEPCDVCGAHNDNEIEPRFLYTVCREHRHIRPVDVPRRTA